jgi:WD40 repeat protein
VRLWDVATGEERARASGGGDQTVKLWDLATGKGRATLKGHTNIQSLQFTAGGKTLFSRGTSGTIKLWEIATEK